MTDPHAPRGTQPGRLDVVLCWHMHQPDYRLDGHWQRPWTWLHAIKDYADMASHLERVPGARAVVNFSPALLVQLQDLDIGLAVARADGSPVGDVLLDALAGRWVADENLLQRALLRVHEQNMAGRFVAYRRLAERAASALGAGALLPVTERNDLLCWYTLCWLGESVREDPRAVALQGQATGFTEAQRLSLLQLVGETISELLPRYRALADSGAVELSVSPYSHPILPLLLDFGTATESMPGVVLPAGPYPGGAARCDWQLAEALRVFREAFGREPAGCWPSEGGLSGRTLEVLGRHGFGWTASGSRVLHHSLDEEGGWPHLRSWRLARLPGPVCFFRDDGLSDRIGFVYATWPPAQAVADFIRQLEIARANAPRGESAVMAIIMDGENAWEYYDRNGWEFLQQLYGALAGHPALNLTTFSDVLSRLSPQPLPHLRAGSWVHGTFSTWIGGSARNRAWSLLVDAKRAVDETFAAGHMNIVLRRRVERQLAVCEASDWFWWLDEGNPHPDVSDFDRLFRQQLGALYRLVERRPPNGLAEPLVPARRGSSVAPVPPSSPDGAMRRSQDPT